MKIFLFVLAFILILFGASIWYYRASPGGGLPISFFSQKNTDSGNKDGNVLSGKTEAENYKTLEVVEGTTGKWGVGAKRVFFAVAKTDTGGSVSVSGNWSLSDSAIGVIDSPDGTETTMTAIKEGQTTLFLSYQNLKAEKQISIGGAVLGSNVSLSPTPSPTPKPSVTTAPTATVAPPRVLAVNIYDPDGRRMVVGDQRNFQAKVVMSDGKEKIVDVDWSLNADLGTLSRVHSSGTDFKALKMGNGVLTATYQGVSASISLQVN